MANVSSSNGLEKYPKLRFKGFSEPWKVGTAEELFDNVVDKNHPEETVLTIIQGQGTLPREAAGRNIHYDTESLSGYKRVMKNDYVIHLRSFEGGLEIANSQGIVSPAYTILRSKQPCAPLFFDSYFHTDEFINHVLYKAVEGIRDGRQISYEAFKWLSIPYCSLEEQTHIAAFIEKINVRIEKQRSLVENLKKYKRGLLSFVFKDCSSWEVKPLGNLCRIRTGKLDANAMVADGIYPFFTCARESYKIDTYAFDCDALLISGNGANVGYIHHYCGKFNAYQRTYVLDGFNENIKYIQYFLEAFLSSRIDSEKKAGNTPYIVLGTLSEMDIFIPSMETQENIATMLTSIDRRINLEEQHYSHLTAIHKGIMQSIFI